MPGGLKPFRTAMALLGAVVVVVLAAGAAASAAELDGVLARIPIASVFPGAERTAKPDGDPPAAAVLKGGAVVGYVFLTSDVVRSVGYSGKPVKILAGIDLSARITGAAVAEHHEPILVLGIPETKIAEFLAQFRGLDIRRPVRIGRARDAGETALDMVSGASITSLVFNDGILRAARGVARSRGLLAAEAAASRIDKETYRPADWHALVAEGALRRLRVSNADAVRAFEAAGGGAPWPAGTRPDPNDAFIDLYTALATPATIGQNLLGFAAYNALMTDLAKDEEAIFVAATGLFSFRGYNYRQSGVFDRLRLIQGEREISLTAEKHRRIDAVRAERAPELREASVFIIPSAASFDAAQPWRLEVLAGSQAANATSYASFPLSYDLPSSYVRTAATSDAMLPMDEPLWRMRWRDNLVHVVVVGAALGGLLTLLVLQDWAVRHKRLFAWVRPAFLIFTLAYVGWTVSAQLSTLNVLTFANAFLTGFDWEFFLMEPVIFMLWGFVAVALLFWGRGVFCGWLCPFGALQELTNRLAVRLGVRQVAIPFAVNERLWPIKYVIFLGLFALSLGPVALAEMLTEVEPFKTSIALKFVRTWPFVLYAAALLTAGLFVQRAFCRYLCPLGGALAIPSSARMFQWLKRRHQCGTECHICAAACPVQAIHPEGHINPHECIYCLDCQALYHDDRVCPPLVRRRKRREERLSLERKREGGDVAADTAP